MYVCIYTHTSSESARSLRRRSSSSLILYVCMYVWMDGCVRICTYMYVKMPYEGTDIYIHTHIYYVYTYVCTSNYTYLHSYLYTHIHTHTYAHTCITVPKTLYQCCPMVYACIYIYIYIYTHTHTYICAYLHNRAKDSLSVLPFVLI